MSTTTRRRSITKTHERISQLGWEPDYFQPADKYPTRYTFPLKAKDPMKHIMREYLPMELEKDERVYGGQDAAVRAEMTEQDRAAVDGDHQALHRHDRLRRGRRRARRCRC